jgi:hypothetical protein
MNEVFLLESAAEAFDLMMSGKAGFRAVLTTGQVCKDDAKMMQRSISTKIIAILDCCPIIKKVNWNMNCQS